MSDKIFAKAVSLPFKGKRVDFLNVTEDQYNLLMHYSELSAAGPRRSAQIIFDQDTFIEDGKEETNQPPA